ncbi:TrkH family potassium uptake protein [Corynebacterium silvaticum]|uniref:TrkH family potassium uptake protein n=1 Tax=Corynebacterium silvaticum TaxID=2320431 RepID=A0A7Y4PAA0_9CORY|nr:TrkH family potassium uptake protein [Corynebacterium silvaticum]ARU46705.1 TrkH family potassium uptake protein [Corynebacterium silvaticum]NON71099.1 TrkH family potassium uptake protein [Corynebacterium silvaticum]UWG99942.1 TrkH family potassium uptake protein [Corynebacterium silvaticum]UWH01985.1 TrkH family potassium uptake protein [Corynebacterium silvaticum]UWH04022.1 TrkH family potassium uptake protein [Corynebacterium silvaticum]
MRKTPARLVAGSFATLVIIGTLVLLLPISREGQAQADVITALFTATSAVCLTGLTVVDTATYWSHFGQLVILLLIQLGGLGIMTLTSFAAWVLVGRIGVRDRLNAAAEGRGRELGEVKGLLVATFAFTVVVESAVALVLTLRFKGLGFSWGASLWEGVFHSVSAFNNAGFGLRSDNLVPYVGDFGIILPISGAIILGGLGFTLLLELHRRHEHRAAGIAERRFSLTAVFTIVGTLALLITGTVGIAAFEWRGVLSGFSVPTKLLASFFQSVTSRTAGFNSINIGEMHPSSLLLTDFLMFIGGGSGGTAGGIKITTVAVLLTVMVAEIRGDDNILIRGRRIPTRTVRQALAVTMLATLLVSVSLMTMLLVAPEFEFLDISFEVVSAFATVGLSTGITPDLPSVGKLLLVLLMYAGRVGPVSLVAALAARSNKRLYSYPVERPIIG